MWNIDKFPEGVPEISYSREWDRLTENLITLGLWTSLLTSQRQHEIPNLAVLPDVEETFDIVHWPCQYRDKNVVFLTVRNYKVPMTIQPTKSR